MRNLKFLISVVFMSIIISSCSSTSDNSGSISQSYLNLPTGFVYVKDIDTSIINGLRYPTALNFTNRKVLGYRDSAVILTKKAALALKCAQQKFNKDGYSIVVYDAYRPQQAVDDFFKWSQDPSEQAMKKWFYPRIDKSKVLELGYVATQRSTHSRGSTVDITIIEKSKMLTPIKAIPRKLSDDFTFLYLDDGTIDMGSAFDLFDPISHYKNDFIQGEFAKNRAYLKNIMESCQFKNYKYEWWHYTLEEEPFPDTYFNFEVKF